MVDRYVDATANGDSGNALTPETAKQHYRPIAFALNRSLDQNVWIKAGYFYDVDAVGNGMPGLVASHVRIRRYGEGGNPCFDGRTFIAPGSNRFTYVGASNGGFVWKLQLGTGENIHRVWSRSTNNGIRLEDRTVGIALRRTPDATGNSEATILAALKEDCPWHGADNTQTRQLYMWTKTQVDPADAYQGLSCIQAGAGTFGFDVAFRIRQAQDILIKGIDFFGARSEQIIVYSHDDDAVHCNSIVIEDCNFKGILTKAIMVQTASTSAGIASGRPLISDVFINRCTTDANTAESEQEYSNALYLRLTGPSDHIFFTGRMENVRCENTVIKDAYHSAATLGAVDANSAVPRKTGFRNVKAIASPWNAYARGFQSTQCEDSCFFDRIVCDGMNVRSQFVGGPLITSPLFINQRESIRKEGQDTDGHISIESYIGDSGSTVVGTDRYVYNKPTNVRILNGTFGPCPGTPIQINSYLGGSGLGGGLPPATIDAGAISVIDCVWLDTNGSRRDLPFMKFYQDNGLSIGTQKIINNSVWKGAGAPEPVVVNLTPSTSQSYTVDTAPGFSLTIKSDPKVDASLRPMPTSPLISAAITPGLKLRDTTGRYMKPKQNIGAYDTL